VTGGLAIDKHDHLRSERERERERETEREREEQRENRREGRGKKYNLCELKQSTSVPLPQY